MSLLENDITLKQESVSKDVLSLRSLFNLNMIEIVKYINNLRSAFTEIVVPEVTVSQDDVITAINSLRLSREIFVDLTNLTSYEYSDGETITRSGNQFIISHPRVATSALYRLEGDGNIIASVTTTGNQFVVEFEELPESNPYLIIL